MKQITIMPVPKAGVLYFGLVFGAGCVLGTIRTLWGVPRIGTRMAELLETPIMLFVTTLAARWTVLQLGYRPRHLQDWRWDASPSSSC